MKTTQVLTALFVFMLLGAGTVTGRQGGSTAEVTDNKIHIELRRSDNGEKKVFKKDYDSREEILADKELKDFLENEDLNLYFFGDEDKTHVYNFGNPDGRSRTFRFYRGDSAQAFGFGGPHSFFVPDVDDDVFVFSFPRDSGVHSWMRFPADRMFAKPLLPDDLDSLRQSWEDKMGSRGGSGRFFYHFDDGDKNVRRRLGVVGEKKVSISELKEGEEVLDKRPKKMETLVPTKITYFPNPGDGRFTLQMELPTTEPLQISVVDLSGKVLYEEEVKTFNGTYRKDFDLSGEETGIYLLNVVQANKRLVRKVMIN